MAFTSAMVPNEPQLMISGSESVLQLSCPSPRAIFFLDMVDDTGGRAPAGKAKKSKDKQHPKFKSGKISASDAAMRIKDKKIGKQNMKKQGLGGLDRLDGDQKPKKLSKKQMKAIKELEVRK